TLECGSTGRSRVPTGRVNAATVWSDDEQPGANSAVPESDRGPLAAPGHHGGNGERGWAAGVRGTRGARRARARSNGRRKAPDCGDQKYRAHMRRRDFGRRADPGCTIGGRITGGSNVSAVQHPRTYAHDSALRAWLYAAGPVDHSERLS